MSAQSKYLALPILLLTSLQPSGGAEDNVGKGITLFIIKK